MTEAKLVTSHCAAIALTPSFSTSAATASARSRRKSLTTTPPALFSAKRSATARPTPCPAPVTRPTRPFRSRMLLLKSFPPEFRVLGEYARLTQLRDFRLRHFQTVASTSFVCSPIRGPTPSRRQADVRSSENRGPSISASPKTGSLIWLRWPASRRSTSRAKSPLRLTTCAGTPAACRRRSIASASCSRVQLRSPSRARRDCAAGRRSCRTLHRAVRTNQTREAHANRLESTHRSRSIDPRRRTETNLEARAMASRRRRGVLESCHSRRIRSMTGIMNWIPASACAASI